MADEKKVEVKEVEVKLNKDGLPIGQPVTFEQIAKANMVRSKRIKEEAEVKANAKAKSK